jgi:Bcr/CflA subfamily drug resistance transporter
MNLATAKAPHLVTLIFLSGLSVASLNLFLPSLQNIAADFRVDYARVTLAIAGYAAVAAVLQLIVGPISDRFGRRPVILGGLAIFSAASAGCLLATDFTTFLFFRMLQAVIISGATVSRAVIMDSYGARKGAGVMGYVAMVWALAPMVAPMAGGILDELFGWRADFWTFLSIGLALLALCWFDLTETNSNRSESMLSQMRTYPELFRSGPFWGYTLCTAFSTSAFYVFLGGVPVVASAVFGITPGKLGFYIAIITLGFIIGSFVAGRFSTRHRLSTMMLVGRVIGCGALVLSLILLSLGIVPELVVFGAVAGVGIGNGVSAPSSNAGTMAVRPKLAGSASGLSGALTNAVGAVVAAITGALITADNAAFVMLAMMLLVTAVGSAAAVYVRWRE